MYEQCLFTLAHGSVEFKLQMQRCTVTSDQTPYMIY